MERISLMIQNLKSFSVGLFAILTSSVFWTVIAGLAAVGSTVAAFITIRDTNIIRREEIESRRPFMVLKQPKFSVQQDQLLTLNFLFQNEGVRPASDIDFLVKSYPVFEVLDLEKQEDSLVFQLNSSFRLSADILNGQATPWYFEDLDLKGNVVPTFFYLLISYQDAVLEKVYQKRLFLKWEGMKSGVFKPDLVYATQDEAERIQALMDQN